MSTSADSLDVDFGDEEQEEEAIKIGLYIGGRNAEKERNGRGWAVLPNGEHYDGCYRKGRRHGLGLYVFLSGARYYGQYKCGVRSGKGTFIYPDGSIYDGMWRKNLKHGQGTYYYSNGDKYYGTWYRNKRHGIGFYTQCIQTSATSIQKYTYKSTWRDGSRCGPFELSFGKDNNCTTLHGVWNRLYPEGPAVFNFNNSYLQIGYFQAQNSMSKSKTDLELIEEEDNDAEQLMQPSIWFAQDICPFDYSLLPQEPIPLPLSDSEESICSLSTMQREETSEKSYLGFVDEAAAEENGEDKKCLSYEQECCTSEIESASSTKCDNPCDIDNVQLNCNEK